MQKVTSVDVVVPSTEDFRMHGDTVGLYSDAQALFAEAVKVYGLKKAISDTASGISRELLKHLEIPAAQELFRGLAESMPEVAKYDVTKPSGEPTVLSLSDIGPGLERSDLYSKSQIMLAEAIKAHGLQIGVTVVISGISRELRRHLDIPAAQKIFRQVADMLPSVAK